ncbi:MAG: VOC family protein [Schlesneria sp.]
MHIQPYLDFNGRCEEAIEFYREVLGAKVGMLMRFKESPDPHSADSESPDAGNKVMHAAVQIGDTIIFMSDGQCSGSPMFQGINLSLSVSSDAEATERFEALSQNGQVQMPLTKTFFSSSFGMVADQFGVMWMIMVVPQ